MIKIFFEFSKRVLNASEKAIKMCQPYFNNIEETAEYNQQKMLKAFIDSGVSESHFNSSTGYGYGDRGRNALDTLYANVFGAEDALVRHNFVSGTHALTVALFGVLRPGDSVLSITGIPYDTMLNVINGENTGSLKDFGISFEHINYDPNKEMYFENIRNKLKKFFKVVYIQRSRGYTLRDSLSVEGIGEIITFVKRMHPKSIVIVDNCYGEFVQKLEPTQYGADLIVGSLIKNPGGGIAPTGAYIAGRKDLIELCACRLTSPGIGKEVGATLGFNRELFMGTFHAPHIVGEALKTALFAAALFEILGYEVYPKHNENRVDIIQSIKLNTSEALINFCKGVQKGSPIDSFVSPEPWDMPGYKNKVIMAAGTFTLGSSIELSADGPLREPYVAWLQGGLNFHSAKIGVLSAAEMVWDTK